jgi:SAM-dependent methyltransferase
VESRTEGSEGQDRRDAVTRFWNENHDRAAGGAHDNYLNHPLIQAYISMRAFGSLTGHLDAAVHALRERTAPGDRVLSLGCGTAAKERVLAAALPDREFVGIDIADQTVRAAGEEIAAEGLANLRIEHGDFNALDLPPRSVKVLLGLGAIHHVENLEGLWAAAATALTADGVVLAQEYVGPNRFQWTEPQFQACNRALATLVPEAHKVHHRTIARIPVEDLIAIDPSEAVRSAEILPTCRDAGWQIEGLVGAGGALLQPVLMYQVHTFDPADWEHNLVLARLFAEEDRLMRAEVIGDDFAMFVARPPC